MKSLVALISYIYFTTIQASIVTAVKEDCLKPTSLEEFVYGEDFSGSFTKDQLLLKEKEIYDSGKRLKGRAYFTDSGQLVVPHGNGNLVRIDMKFIRVMARHVVNAFERGYVEALIFPDMGHNHFFIDMEFFKSELDDIPVKDQHLLYEKVLAHSKTKYLYHTAEKVAMLDENRNLVSDKWTQWRYYTRNLVGDTQGNFEFLKNLDSQANTAHMKHYFDDAKYREWGAGFNLSASVNGCFLVKRKGKPFRFDISLHDLPYRSFW